VQKRILAKVSRIPSLKEACQYDIRLRMKTPENVEKLTLPKLLNDELCAQFQWFTTYNDGICIAKL